MGPRVLVCRKGDSIFLTVKGEITYDSSGELLAVVRQLLMTSLKCTAPGTQVTYCLKTSGTVDLEKMAHLQPGSDEHPGDKEVCADMKTGQEQEELSRQREPQKPRPRHGLILLKGGVF
jgi:hypothetical protein